MYMIYNGTIFVFLNLMIFFKARKAAEMAELQRKAEIEANNQVNMKEIEREKITEMVTTMGLSVKEVNILLDSLFSMNEN
jgi:hypothetical protein